MVTESQHHCTYCDKLFVKANSLAVHMCETKRRYKEKDDIRVQFAFMSYLRFFEITQGSARLKTFDDFARSPYYRAFVKFGRYAHDTHILDAAAYLEWLLKNNKKIDHWCKDQFYTEYLIQYVHAEPAAQALLRSMLQADQWAEKNNSPGHDYLRYGNTNRICHDIFTGRLSAWAVYNCDSGIALLESLTQEQTEMIYPMIDPDHWNLQFKKFPADVEIAKATLIKAGW